MDKKQITGNLLLLTTATIWGMAFVAQRVGMDYVGPLTFSWTRFVLAILVLIPVVHFMDKSAKKQIRDGVSDKKELSPEELKQQKKELMKASIVCGCVLFTANILQQIGLVSTSAGKTGFITALYIVLVPVFSVVLKRRPGLKCWIGVILGTVGLYFLCITSSFTIAPGDFVVLIGAAFWATHILVIDHFLPKVADPIRMSMYQFVVVAVLSFIGALIFEDMSISGIIDCAIPILYAGALSGGVGFTFQILGQKHTNPTVASLILSLEAVFGAIFGFLILKEMMTPREIAGCLMMFCAIIISQLPDRKKPETI
ncbi:MAG TPA: DMT family transporter [Anaerovoracaceae bacterium]|nr:DMT family transporter [Anaerovoracaceae bacterium]